MIGLLAAVELFIARHAVDFTPWGGWAWVCGGQAVHEAARGCEVLCFGDSLVKLGMLPRVIEERIGQRTYNLAICGAEAPVSYFLLRRALEEGARPKAVLVNHSPDMLAGAPRHFARTWPELLRPRECLELSWYARDSTFFAATSLAILFPSIRARQEIRTCVLLALLGRGSYLHDDTVRYWRNWIVNKGGQATAKNPLFHGEVDPALSKRLLTHVWCCNRVNLKYIRWFLELAQAHDIRVFWLLPPITPLLQQERERAGTDLEQTRFVRDVQDKYPNVLVIDGRHSGYGHWVFIDPIHLDSEGACTLSADVAAIIARSQAARAQMPGWVALPDYRFRPTDVAMEEIVDFNVALKLRERRLLR